MGGCDDEARQTMFLAVADPTNTARAREIRFPRRWIGSCGRGRQSNGGRKAFDQAERHAELTDDDFIRESAKSHRRVVTTTPMRRPWGDDVVRRLDRALAHKILLEQSTKGAFGH